MTERILIVLDNDICKNCPTLRTMKLKVFLHVSSQRSCLFIYNIILYELKPKEFKHFTEF